jgi:deoxyribonuclease-4
MSNPKITKEKVEDQILVGGHVSMSGGLDKAAQRAADIGGNCMQIFSGSPRMWRRKDLSKFKPKKLAQAQAKQGIKATFIHALYLINLSSDKEELVDKSTKAIIYDLKLDSLIGSQGVVVHLGSHQGRGWQKMRDQVADRIDSILEQTPADSQLLIENSAGQNGKLASELAEIRWLLDEVQSDRLGWCFDTCHGFAAGYYLGDPAEWVDREQGRGAIFKAIDQYDLAASLKCIHVNDSATEFNSGRDRHENIGQGKIPQNDLKYFLNHELIKDQPLITEVPGLDGHGPDRENINRIKRLLA